VPRVSYFHGISIYMYWDETHHRRPHFHAHQGGDYASVAFDGEVLAGSLSRRSLAFVRKWTALHQVELEANWERARRGEPLEPVEPLA
jgi:hypothetical protein